ncbi:MAG: hypothetical protein WAT93_04710 [Pontixanthobacter sp.]
MKNFLAALAIISGSLISVTSAAKDQGTEQASLKKYPGDSDVARLSAFMADPDHADVVARAKAGDPGSMFALANLVNRKLAWQQMSQSAVLEMRSKLLAGAMAKDWAPAYLEFGRMFRRGEIGEGGLMAAYSYFLKGAQLGNEDSLSEAWAIALNPNICSNCASKDDGRIRLVKEDGLAATSETERFAMGKAYLAEKREMIDQVRPLLLAAYDRSHNRAAEGLVTLYADGLKVNDPFRAFDLYDVWVVKPDGVKAESLLKEVAANSMRDSWASLLLGLYYVEPKQSGIAVNQSASIRYLELAAQGSDANAVKAAQFLGHELVTGKLYRQDVPKALTLLKTAADKGSVDALYDLGLINMLGKGMTKNPNQAAAHFRAAIAKGHAPSAEALAQMYADGDFGKVDETMATYYYRKAAELKK